MTFIPVVVKRNKCLAPHVKYWGGLLHVEHRSYVRFVQGNCNPVSLLSDIKKELLKKAA